MGGRTQKVEIDAAKVRAFMKRKGYTAVGLSYEIGTSSSYMGRVLKECTMSTLAYKAMCAVFEVPEDTFTKPQPETFTATLEAVPDAEIMERLDRIEQKVDKLLAIWG